MNQKGFDEMKFMILLDKISRLLRKHTGFPYTFRTLSILQIQTLMTIRFFPSITMTKIAQELGIELSSATDLVERLIRAGFVKRVADEKDRRLVKVVLLKKGETMLQKSFAFRKKHACLILRMISHEDKKLLYTILNKLFNKLKKTK